jgi:hypothetical protein
MAMAKPGQTPEPTLTVYGGELTIDDVRVILSDENGEMPKSNQRYLLFVVPFGATPGVYQINRVGIFEVNGSKLRSLVKGSESSAFREITDRFLGDVVAEVRRSVPR